MITLLEAFVLGIYNNFEYMKKYQLVEVDAQGD